MSVAVAVSLVVATVDRVDELGALLDSLAALPHEDFEVVLADQNGDDRLVPLVRRHARAFTLRHLRLEERHACRARNLGAAAAAGNWLGFPDDDCRFQPDTLEVLRAIVADRRPELVTGCLFDEHGRAIVGGDRGPGPLTALNAWGRLSEACIFVTRQRFLGVGGFDAHFGPGGRYHAAEGLELVLRMFERGPPLAAWFDPRLRVLHPRKQLTASGVEDSRAYRHGMGIGAAAALHPRPAALANLGWLMTKSLRAALRHGTARAAAADHARGLAVGFCKASYSSRIRSAGPSR